MQTVHLKAGLSQHVEIEDLPIGISGLMNIKHMGAYRAQRKHLISHQLLTKGSE